MSEPASGIWDYIANAASRTWERVSDVVKWGFAGTMLPEDVKRLVAEQEAAMRKAGATKAQIEAATAELLRQIKQSNAENKAASAPVKVAKKVKEVAEEAEKKLSLTGIIVVLVLVLVAVIYAAFQILKVRR